MGRGRAVVLRIKIRSQKACTSCWGVDPLYSMVEKVAPTNIWAIARLTYHAGSSVEA